MISSKQSWHLSDGYEKKAKSVRTKMPISTEVHIQCTQFAVPQEERRKEELCNAAATGWSDPSEGCWSWSGVQINVAFMLTICPQVSGDRNSKSLSLMNEYTMTVVCGKGSSHRNMVGEIRHGLKASLILQGKTGVCVCVRVCTCAHTQVCVFSFNH